MKSKIEAEKRFLESCISKDYTPLDPYKTALTHIRIRCNKDGHVWKTTPNNIMSRKRGCPWCSNSSTEKSLIRLHDQCRQSNIEMIGEYVNNGTKTEFRCLVDGYTWLAKPNNIINGRSCPWCCGRAKERAILNFLNSCYGMRITPIEDYSNSSKKIDVSCDMCGFLWKARPNDIGSGYGCPNCNTHGGYNKEKPAWIYLFRWESPTSGHSFLKCGVTNKTDYMDRIVAQSRKTEYLPTKVYCKKYEKGEDALVQEQFIKNSLKNSVVSKDMFPDGYTETYENTEENSEWIILNM